MNDPVRSRPVNTPATEQVAQHTPGPWRFDEDWRRLPTIFGADGNKVAIIEKDRVDAFGWVKPLDERRANARLIEAAPFLLAAVQNLLTWRDGNENVPPGHNGNEPWNWARDAAARATGNSQ